MYGQVGQPPLALIVEIDLAPTMEGRSALVVVLIEDEQHSFEKFKKIDAP